MKKFVSAMLICFIVLSSFTFTAMAEEEINVVINGEKLISDVPAQSVKVFDENGSYVGDRTMLPIRAISEKLNCDVYWNEQTKGITIYRKNTLSMMWLEEEMAFHLDGLSLSKGYKMDIPPKTTNGRTLVPVRAVAELLGATVNWIEETNTVDIKLDLGTTEENKGIAESCVIYEVLLHANKDVYSAYVEGRCEKVTGKFILANGKEMSFELYPELAPETCKQFITLAKDNFYENTIFHRVIKDFVAQGGGFDDKNTPKLSGNVTGEFLINGRFNLIPHRRGTLSLARADHPDSGSSQFFICHKDTPFLDGGYAAFGKLTGGFDVLDEICLSETDSMDKPVSDIILSKVIINE